MKRTLNTTINRSKNEKNDEFYTRVRKVTQEAATTFFYDGWDLIEERVSYTNGTSSTIHYYWGKDLSGTLQGAGGVGGLLYLTVDGAIYIPFYDNNGNVTRYLDANGNTVAQYTYDAFGNIINQAGTMADVFAFRFSTKYFDAETGLYYYGYRFYSPTLMRWMNRDPIGEDGGVNLYAQCGNNLIARFDTLGLFVYKTLAANYPLKSTYPTEVSSTNSIWHLIGGKVLQNAKGGIFNNSCAIRLSHALNKSGELIPYIKGQTSSGKNPPKWWYIYRVTQMKAHLTQKYGKPMVYNSKEKFEKCAPKGILVLDVPGWSDASGHATLWNGITTIDDAQKEYFGKPNVKFNLWKEK